ncbi:MAG: hypothetical protein JNL73_04500 [Anaerolineales bacterium]|nr:hypothetical protein [Anaerolineales bacterium]
MAQPKSFIVSDNARHRFSRLRDIPETQLTLLVPHRVWGRLQEYVQSYEAVALAGRFGADPGDFEWEWVAEPEGLRWWRRATDGTEYLFGLAAAVHTAAGVELYGMVSVDEASVFWADVVSSAILPELNDRARLIAHDRHLDDDSQALAQLRREHYRARGLLTHDVPGELAIRCGTIREVERLQIALQGLLDRCAGATLPSEARRRQTGQFTGTLFSQS